MTSSQRIGLNTLATYGRTVFGMALGLFSSRWVLQSLGAVDYGLMGVVGALIVFVTFLNGVTANSCARFFAYSIGQGDADETNNWFNSALFIHLFLPVILVVVGWPMGEWAINNFLNIPVERLSAARWVFRLSLVSAFTSMCFTPYIGMFTAKQRIYEMSAWGILQTMLMFGLAFSMTLYKRDAWLMYSAGTVAIMILLGFCQVFRARCLFKECEIKIKKWTYNKYFKEMFSFAGWQLFGVIGTVLRGQGTAILLNKYFNPQQFSDVNASYSVANTLSGYTQTLSAALLGAFTPEITASEGRGERESMLINANRSSKFGTFLVLLFAIPLMVEIKYVLAVWLKNPPELAWLFCVLILVQYLIDKITYGQMVAVSAKGQIRGYQIMLGSFLIMTLPVAWIFLAMGLTAISVCYAFIITMILCSGGRVIWAKYLVGQSPVIWFKEVFTPCLIVLMCGFTVGIIVHRGCGTASFFRLVAVTGATSLSWVVLGWFVVLNSREKTFFVKNVNKLNERMRSWKDRK